MFVGIAFHSRLGKDENRASGFDHEAGGHALPRIGVEELLRSTHDDHIDVKFGCRSTDRCCGVGSFEYTGITRDTSGFKCLSDRVGDAMAPFREVGGNHLVGGSWCDGLAQRMPRVGVETLEKVPRHLNDGCDGYVSCATDQVACEVDNSARSERPCCSDEYVHELSIGEERAQTKEHREETEEGKERSEAA